MVNRKRFFLSKSIINDNCKRASHKKNIDQNANLYTKYNQNLNFCRCQPIFSSIYNASCGIHWISFIFGFLLSWLAKMAMKHMDSLSNISKTSPTLQVSTDLGRNNVKNGESVEWVNMCWKKIWRVYQRSLERWLLGVLQPVFNNIVNEGSVPQFVQKLTILELNFDHEAPYFSNMRRKNSRKDSDLNGVVDVRYTGGARMLLMLEVGTKKWNLQVPVLVSDLDIDCQLWLKIRLAPLSPYFGTISFAFVKQPNIKVQLSPYNRVRLMRVPVLQKFLTKLFTIDLPSYMVLPKRLDINIPPAITAVAEAAVGRDTVMRAVANAVLKADALEQALIAALPLGPQAEAGGISVPESFQGELRVFLIEGRNLPVWGFPWQSNPYCRLMLGNQAVNSKRENDTSCKGSHRNPIWNQEFEFLIEDKDSQDSHITGKPDVGKVEFSLFNLPHDDVLNIWLPVKAINPKQKSFGSLHLEITSKPFVDEITDSEKYGNIDSSWDYNDNSDKNDITDVKSAAEASARAAAKTTAAFSTIAVTRAAAARAAHKAQKSEMLAQNIASLGKKDEDSGNTKKINEYYGINDERSRSEAGNSEMSHLGIKKSSENDEGFGHDNVQN